MAVPPAPPRTWLPTREVVDVTRNAIQSFALHHTNRMAAALAYYTLFSLFPLLLLLLAVIGFMLDAGWPIAVDARQYLVDATDEILPAVGALVSTALESVQRGRSASGIIGVLGLLWSASSTFNQLHVALDQIWGLNCIPKLSLTVRRRAVSIAIVLGLGLLLLVAQGVKSVTFWFAGLTDQLPGGGFLQGVFTWVFPFIIATLAFGLMFRIFPSLPISWQDVWPGAVLAGVGWELLKLLFALYAVEFANWQAVYGPVAGVIALLTWLYLSFTIILFGAEFAAAYSAQLRAAPTVSVDSQVQHSAAAQPVAVRLAAANRPGVWKPEAVPRPTRRRAGPSLAAGTVAGILGGVAALGVGVGLLLKWRPGRPTAD